MTLAWVAPERRRPGRRADPRRRIGVVAGLSLILGLGLGCGRRSNEPDPSRPELATPQPAMPTILGASATEGAEWTASLGPRGSARVRWRGVDLMRVDYPFWTANWAWANAEIVERPLIPGSATPLPEGVAFGIDVPGLGTRIGGEPQAADPGVFQLRYAIEVAKTLGDVIGGGLEFRLRADVLAARPGYAPPTALPGQRGFRWSVGDDQAITVRFTPAPLKVLIDEDGDYHRVRVQLIGAGTEAGSRAVTMQLELPAGGIVGPSLDQRYSGGDDPWFPATLQWDHTPIDLRHLNEGHRPAGTHGRVEVHKDELRFADGTPARFWGTNVVGYSLFHIDQATARAQARRIAALGFNLVRIHHHDSPWVEPNVFVTGLAESQTLNDEALDKLDWWVRCLQDEGIYVWLDLHVGRQLRAGDQIPGFEELSGRNGALHGFNYVNRRIETLMQDFARRYLDRKNRYTGRRYADDPGVMGVLITNENDLTHHFGNLMNEDAGAPQHRAMLRALVEPFAQSHGLPIDQAMQPWQFGPAKIALNEVEARFHLRFIEFLHGLGMRAPVATTSYWGDDPMASLPALTVGNVIDLHSYGEEGELDNNPLYSHTFLHRIAAGAVEGMPTTITEWNLYPPVRDRFVAPVWMAAMASLQGWDAPMHYCYTDPPLPPGDQLHMGMGLVDPSTMALMPAAALAFRQGHVQPAKERYRIVFDKEQLYGRPMNAQKSAAIRTLTEQSRVEIALPDLNELGWDTRVPAPPGATTVDDPSRSFLPADATAVVSDTGELSRDWTIGVGTLNTPKTQAAYGWIGGRTITLGDVELRIDTPKATVVVSALDDRPIHESADLLVSVAAQTSSSGGKAPLRAQSVSGALRLKSQHPAMVLRPITSGSDGALEHAGVEQPGTRTGDALAFTLPSIPTHWFRITPR